MSSHIHKERNVEAEKQLVAGNYVLAAELMADDMTEPFEVMVLKFLGGGAASRSGLKCFLELQLKRLELTNVLLGILSSFKACSNFIQSSRIN